MTMLVLMAIVAGILIVAAVVEARAKSVVRACAFGICAFGLLAIYFLAQAGVLLR